MLKYYYKSKKLLFYTQADVSFNTTTFFFHLQRKLIKFSVISLKIRELYVINIKNKFLF